MTDFKDIAEHIDFIGTVGNDTDYKQLTTVLPDNSIILGFQLGQQVYERLGDKHHAMTASGVCGQLTTQKHYLNTPNSQTILVKFKPWTATCFFNGIENFTNQNIDLADIIPSQVYRETLNKIYDHPDKINVVKSFLLQQFKPKQTDLSILHSIDIINQSGGQIRVEKLAYEVCHSKRNFERKFKSATGITPKQFIDNVRFQHSLKLLQSNNDLQEVAFYSGYYDLSHFINDFKSVTGTTPEKFIS